MTTHQERRTQPRFSLPIGYTPIAIRMPEDKFFTLEGHAYDISRGGVQFELDRPLEPGTRVALKIELPNGSRIIALPGSSEKTIRVYAGVDLLLVDEAARVEDALFHSITPMLATSATVTDDSFASLFLTAFETPGTKAGHPVEPVQAGNVRVAAS